jgi:tetratricopeptide (TPR) repeat protein
MRRGAVIAVGLAGLAHGCAGLPRRADRPPTPERAAAMQATSQAAQDAFDHNDWPRAQAQLELLAAEAPRSAEVHNRLGRVLLAEGRTTEAAAAFRIALAIDTEYVDALIGLGQTALATGNFQDALRYVDQAIELEPTRPEANLARGRALEAVGRPGDAQAAYFRALEADSTLAPASLRISALQLDQGRFDQVLARLDGVVELTPEDPEARFLRGRAHLALRETALALEDLTFASKRLPNRPEVFYSLALALDASQKSGDALKAAERASTLAPGWAEARELSAKLRR